MQKFGSRFSYDTILLRKSYKKNPKTNAYNRKISPQSIILHDGNASMHDIKSAMLTIILNGLVSAVRER